MSAVLDTFLQEARNPSPNWDTVFRNLNGLDMYEMLRGLNSLTPALQEMISNQSGVFIGSYGIDRIRYALDVVRLRRIPATAPGDLEQTGQVQDARNFLAQVHGGTATKKTNLRVSLFQTRAAQADPLASQLVQKATELLQTNGGQYALDFIRFTTPLPFDGDVLIDDEFAKVRDLADAAGARAERLTMIFMVASANACRSESIQCQKPAHGSTPKDRFGKSYSLINTDTGSRAADHATLLHEMGHAAGLNPGNHESDQDNFMSLGSNRTKMRDDQLAVLGKAFFAIK
jgi:hypothetical protein